MTPVTTAHFVIHLLGACALGALVGLERQLHQRMAGSRTNALVAAGASAFVMAGSLISGDPSAPGRMAPFVVSGVGFLGAGVIFKDGPSVHGLNTAATVWCSAAMGVLAGLNSLHLASILAAMVILTNIALRPLLGFLHLGSPAAAESIGERFEIVIICRTDDEMRLRALLLTAIGSTRATLHSIQRCEGGDADHTRLQTEICTHGRQSELIEELTARLSIEPSVTSLNWSAASSSR